MNYLAHLYLSRDNDEEMFGNFIGDFVKGKTYNHLPTNVANGVRYHRFIDDYTDNHEITKEMAQRIRPYAKRYAMVVTDIYHDHFLALHWNTLATDKNLDEFANYFYQLPYWKQEWTPERAVNMYPFLTKYDWLNAYKNFDGLTKVFGGMQNRIKNLAPIGNSVDWLKNDYDFFLDCHNIFFPELQTAFNKFRDNDRY
ncbi:DUF479 domain-containing protein [Flammeovirga pectinis]|uniref:DUF479 domain-containing protein n=1 Tax=Flammeovirga pectinis TaxID=2494373 RepID=A0A3Q9FK75_9BACT|nr:ACP phosphodiesterase [Flammeovirga pectinis]AZQ61584.1 DUF479 domain-containing protein [Flammeovirga pectinis]